MCNIIDLKASPVRVIAERLNSIWLGKYAQADRKEFYCGITNDIERRLAEHNAQDWHVGEVVALADCGTADKAAEVEGLMREKGFDVGGSDNPGNGGVTDSTYVYLVRKKMNEKTGMKPLTDFLKEFNRNR